MSKKRYTDDGALCRLETELNGVPIVRFAYTQFETGNETQYGEPVAYHGALFKEAPVRKYDERILELRKAETQLLHDVSKKRHELKALRDKEDDIRDRLNALPETRLLLDFLADKITHIIFLSTWAPPVIQTLGEALKDKGDIKLIALFGRKNSPHADKARDVLQWRSNQYSDGSGSQWTPFIPCVSEQEAKETLRELFDEYFQNTSAELLSRRWLEAATENGIDVSKQIRISADETIRQLESKFERTAADNRAEIQSASDWADNLISLCAENKTGEQ